ncbi:MAG: hypothetical protein VKJ06_01460 [Vampirovibrionales bacterium]|nr:hypothetical protein [Vampirovibrionales bacterium]
MHNNLKSVQNAALLALLAAGTASVSAMAAPLTVSEASSMSGAASSMLVASKCGAGSCGGKTEAEHKCGGKEGDHHCGADHTHKDGEHQCGHDDKDSEHHCGADHKHD